MDSLVLEIYPDWQSQQQEFILFYFDVDNLIEQCNLRHCLQ